MSARQRLINEPSTNHLNFVDLPLARQNSNKFDFALAYSERSSHLRAIRLSILQIQNDIPIIGEWHKKSLSNV